MSGIDNNVNVSVLVDEVDDNQPADCNYHLRLTERGHTLENLTPMLKHAASQRDSTSSMIKRGNHSNNNALYIHKVFHPNVLQRKDIRLLYQKILEPVLDFDKMIIAMSRPTNLHDILTKASITAPPDLCIQHLIKELASTQTPLEHNER